MFSHTLLLSLFLRGALAAYIPQGRSIQADSGVARIPYASVPVRFAAPTSPDAACLDGRAGAEAERENCLFLKVFIPAGVVPDGSVTKREPTQKAEKTVMVWLGDLSDSENFHSPAYDGSALATAQDVVVVVPEYRQNGRLPQYVHKNVN
jgi:carboxylesterase type B